MTAIPDTVRTASASPQKMCRFCLNVRQDMSRMDWWQWSHSEVAKLYQDITSNSVLFSEHISEWWCESCLRRLRETAEFVNTLKESSRFWEEHLQTRLLIGCVETERVVYGDPERFTPEPDVPDTELGINPIETPTRRCQTREKQLCEICRGMYVDLERHTKRAHPRAEPLECAMCGRTFGSKSLIRKHFHDDHQLNRFTCEICQKPNISRQYYERHLATHNRSLDNLIGCDECDKSFHGKTRLAVHKTRVHLRSESQCPECGKMFQNMVRLKCHMIRHREKTIACPECPVMFWLTKEMKEHCRTVHRKDRKFVCESCGRAFLMNAQLKRHTRKGACRPDAGSNGAKSREALACRLCNRRCLMVKTLQSHYAKAHSTEDWAPVKDTICQLCIRQFDSAEQLDDHRQSAHRRWSCDLCHRFFLCQESLARHTVSHSTKERPFRCEICLATYITRTKLNAHVRRQHSSDRPHACSLCDKTFPEKFELTNHRLRVHDVGDRVSYSCTVCERSFAKQTSLSTHIAIHHTGTFNWFACRHCDKKFANTHNLTQHHAVHHAGCGPI